MARVGDPNLQLIMPKSVDQAVVKCIDYKPACRFGYKIKIKNIEMIALFYDSQANAAESARYIKGYVGRNWVYDDVRGEPILERFAVKYLEAKKAF